jgi:hypothetical protein
MAKAYPSAIMREVVRTKRVDGKSVIDVLSCGHEVVLHRRHCGAVRKLVDERLCKQCIKEGRLR